MPSLFRFLIVCTVLAAVILGIMVWFSGVEPVEREYLVNVPSRVIEQRNEARLPKAETERK